MGVAYHANYFMWFEVGRSELLRSLGQTYRSLETAGRYLPVIEARCEFREIRRLIEHCDRGIVSVSSSHTVSLRRL